LFDLLNLSQYSERFVYFLLAITIFDITPQSQLSTFKS